MTTNAPQPNLMKNAITTKKFITYSMPGSFFPETSTEEVESFAIPSTLPNDCYGFSFSETDSTEIDEKTFTGETRQMGPRYLVGWIVQLADIPADSDTDILRMNIEMNSPTKEGVRTRMGNWSSKETHNAVLDPDRFKYTEPRIYKKAQPITSALEGMKQP